MMASTETASPPGRAAKKNQWPWWLIAAAGIVSVLISLLIGTTSYTNPGLHRTIGLSAMNGLCSSSIGQFAQMMNARAGTGCASVASLEQWRGWLMVAGIVAIAGGAAWGLIVNRSR